VTVNAGILYLQNTLDGTAGSAVSPVNNKPIILNGGQLNVDTGLGTSTLFQNADQGFRRIMATLNSDIYVNADASIYGRTSANADIGAAGGSDLRSLQRIKSLTFADLGASSGPTGGSMRDGVTLTLSSVYVGGPTNLGAHNNNISVAAAGAYSAVLGGTVTGGLLTKYGQGMLLLAGTSNSYLASVVNGDAAASAVSVLGSLARTGTPFGTGAITVNPGAILRIADSSNIANNAVTILTDGQGLGGIGLAGNFAPPTLLTSGTAAAGQLVLKSSGDYNGVLSLDTNAYTQTLNMGTLGGGRMWLGASQIGNSSNYSGVFCVL
jgi:hypothetical protein